MIIESFLNIKHPNLCYIHSILDLCKSLKDKTVGFLIVMNLKQKIIFYCNVIPYALGMLFETYRLWGFKKWLSFWTTTKKETIVSIEKARFVIRTSNFRSKIADVCTVLECLFHHNYNPSWFNINKNDVVIDIGGHIGAFSIAASKHASIVYSFEPSPENYKQFIKNIRLNGRKNIRLMQHAVASKIGKRTFYLDPLNTGANNLYKKNKYKLSIRTTTLKAFFENKCIKKCHFLKMDCEGAEYEILLTLDSGTLSKIQRIACEYHVPAYVGISDEKLNPALLIEFLQKNNFSVIVNKNRPYQGILYARRI